MLDTTIEQAKEQIKELEKYLPEATKEELSQILEFGEKMKAEGEKKEKEFWNKFYDENSFKNLLIQYEESKEKFIESLLPDEKKMLDNLGGLSREKFYNEYLRKRILYSGEIDLKNDGTSGYIRYQNKVGKFDLEKFKNWLNDYKDSLKPGIVINLRYNKLGDEGVKVLAESWKDSLKPGMEIILRYNKLGEEGVKILAEAWKNSLKPGMTIDLSWNNLGYEGVKILVEAWKDSLQPGMGIGLCNNNLGYEGVKILAETWKDKLQPGMKIDLGLNDLGDEGVKIIMQNLELKEGVTLDLMLNNEISDGMKTQLKEWVQNYNNQGIKCKVLVGKLV